MPTPLVGDDDAALASQEMADSPARSSGASARRPLFRHPGRVAIVAIALVVVVNLVIVLLNEQDTTPGGNDALPSDIQSISPERGQLAGPVDTVSVDLADQYTGVLVIDGEEIPEDELERVVSLQTVSFRPGPNQILTRFPTGTNTAVVKYWQGRLQDRPAKPFSYSWTFRVGA
jgi:hypothetical protein